MTTTSIPRLSDLITLAESGKLTGADLSFASSLIKQAKGPKGLSSKQIWWVGKLCDKVAMKSAPVTTTLSGNVASIFTLFAKAAERGLKRPTITVIVDGEVVRFQRAGSASKYEGQIMVTDGGSFKANRYFGRITPAGELVTGRDLTPAYRTRIETFAADPIAAAKAHGKETGNCCFCSRDLTTEESVLAGYGPVCADKFDLPWGPTLGAVPSAEQASAPEAATGDVIPGFDRYVTAA